MPAPPGQWTTFDVRPMMGDWSIPMSPAKRTQAEAKPAPAKSEGDGMAINTVPAAPATSTAPRAPRPAKISRSQAAAERIEDEYAYITDDLRRVFILAALMFALLIVVNLVFTYIG